MVNVFVLLNGKYIFIHYATQKIKYQYIVAYYKGNFKKLQ